MILGLVITRGGGYTPRSDPMVVFQDSCISDSTRPQAWEPSGRTTSVTGTPAAAAASANRLVLSAINRVDPTRALAIGIASALTALWCGYRLIWLIYTATTLSSIGWSPVSLDSSSQLCAGLAITAFGRSDDRLRLSAGSNRTKTPLDVGVLLISATLSSGTSTLVSG